MGVVEIQRLNVKVGPRGAVPVGSHISVHQRLSVSNRRKRSGACRPFIRIRSNRHPCVDSGFGFGGNQQCLLIFGIREQPFHAVGFLSLLLRLEAVALRVTAGQRKAQGVRTIGADAVEDVLGYAVKSRNALARLSTRNSGRLHAPYPAEAWVRRSENSSPSDLLGQVVGRPGDSPKAGRSSVSA